LPSASAHIIIGESPGWAKEVSCPPPGRVRGGRNTPLRLSEKPAPTTPVSTHRTHPMHRSGPCNLSYQYEDLADHADTCWAASGPNTSEAMTLTSDTVVVVLQEMTPLPPGAVDFDARWSMGQPSCLTDLQLLILGAAAINAPSLPLRRDEICMRWCWSDTIRHSVTGRIPKSPPNHSLERTQPQRDFMHDVAVLRRSTRVR
jgi:hypothetical protein